MSYQRPAFWRVPHNRPDPAMKRKVNIGTPAQKELLRGDIITKIDDYDSRDLRHEDAQNLFRNAGNHIKLVIQRDASLHRTPGAVSNGSSRCSSSMMLQSPLPPPYIPGPGTPYSGSPVPSMPGSYRPGAVTPSHAHQVFPPELPQTVFPPHQVYPPQPLYKPAASGAASPYHTWSGPSPSQSLGRKSPGLFAPHGYHQEVPDEVECISNQKASTK